MSLSVSIDAPLSLSISHSLYLALSLPPSLPLFSHNPVSLYGRAVAFSRRRPIPHAHSGRLKLGPHNGGWPRDGINNQTLIPFRANALVQAPECPHLGEKAGQVIH